MGHFKFGSLVKARAGAGTVKQNIITPYRIASSQFNSTVH